MARNGVLGLAAIAFVIAANGLLNNWTEEPVRFTVKNTEVKGYKTPKRYATIAPASGGTEEVTVDVPGIENGALGGIAYIFNREEMNQAISNYKLKDGQCYDGTTYRDLLGHKHIANITPCPPAPVMK